MVQKLGGGGFGTVYMVQVTFSSVFWSFFLGNIEIDSQRKTNKEMFAAKHQKHTRPDDVAYARNELEILNKVSKIHQRPVEIIQGEDEGVQSHP